MKKDGVIERNALFLVELGHTKAIYSNGTRLDRRVDPAPIDSEVLMRRAQASYPCGFQADCGREREQFRRSRGRQPIG